MREYPPVVVDPVRGHIAVGDLIFGNLGTRMTTWAYSGTSLSPETARDLGQALLTWAADTRFAEGMGEVVAELGEASPAHKRPPCPACGAPEGYACRGLDPERPEWRGLKRAPHKERTL